MGGKGEDGGMVEVVGGYGEEGGWEVSGKGVGGVG